MANIKKIDRKMDIRSDLEWAYMHLGGVGSRGAPSAAARIILEWARKHQWEFIKMMIVRMVPKTAKLGVVEVEVGGGSYREENEGIGLVQKLLRGMDDGVSKNGEGGGDLLSGKNSLE